VSHRLQEAAEEAARQATAHDLYVAHLHRVSSLNCTVLVIPAPAAADVYIACRRLLRRQRARPTLAMFLSLTLHGFNCNALTPSVRAC
jgi:hypothetical protein